MFNVQLLDVKVPGQSAMAVACFTVSIVVVSLGKRPLTPAPLLNLNSPFFYKSKLWIGNGHFAILRHSSRLTTKLLFGVTDTYPGPLKDL
jgi:hypothetical protein